jgi:rhamnosyltransferase
MKGKQLESAPGGTRLSVIIPALDGGRRFTELMEGLARQSLQPDEILVVDSGSADGTVGTAEKYGAQVFRIPAGEFDHGGTRTMAAKKAAGDILVFMTQDAVPDASSSLAILVEAFNDPRVAAAYGRQLPYPGATCFARHLRNFNYPTESSVRCWDDREKYGFKTIFISNSFAGYRRAMLAEAGYFEDGLLFGEDTLAVAKLLRMGYCVAYAADATILHSHDYTVFEDFRRYFDIGVFHRRQKELMDSFGTPLGEGKKYVYSEIRHLYRERSYWRLPESFLRNGLKFLAYRLGRQYEHLPASLAAFCSLNRQWWMKKGVN